MQKAPDTAPQRIYDTARKIFREKGFDGARMQEIADEAKINKALLHYYFKSKEKLFQEILREDVMSFVGSVAFVVNNPATTWQEKIRLISSTYIEFLKVNPGIPIFVLNELSRNGGAFLRELPFPTLIRQSVFMQQIIAAQKEKEIIAIEPMQIIVTVISGLVFPFAAKPMVMMMGGLDEQQLAKLIEERKTLVPDMVIGFLEIKK